MKYKEIKICRFCHIFSEPKHQANTMERERERERRGVPISRATQNTEMESDGATDKGEAVE